MASKVKQEDPWAGFVDVLSSLLVVVVFLVVILGVAVVAISQQITKKAIEQALQQAEQERSKSEPAKPQPPQPVAQQAAPQKTAATSDSEAEGTAGERKAVTAERVRQADDFAGNSNLTVRSVQTPLQKTIEVASEEIAPTRAETEVKASHAILTLKFGKGSFRLDEKTTGEIKQFMADEAAEQNQSMEIRAFAQSTVGSISEARRIAYYRAMELRSELGKMGFDLKRVVVKVRESGAPEDLDVVRIFKK